MKVLTAIANKKYDASAKNALRYEEDVQDKLARCKKNIKRSIEDALDEVAKQIREVGKKIEDLQSVPTINWDRKIDEVLEKASSYEPEEFLLKLDRLFQDKEHEQNKSIENAEKIESLQASVEIANTVLNTASPYKSEDFKDARALYCALNNLKENLIAETRMKNIENLLNGETSEDELKHDA